MEKKQLTQRQLRERKFLVLAPCILVPLVTIVVWGFKKGKAISTKPDVVKGFNMVIPPPHLPDRSGWQKNDYYAQAKQDSLAAAQKNKMQEESARRLGLLTSADSTVHLIENKMQKIKQLAEQPQSAQNHTFQDHQLPKDNPDIEKLERMMGLLKKGNKEDDPEMSQLSTVLDKLIAAQHPEQVQSAPKLAANTLPVQAAASPNIISVLGHDSTVTHNRFYGIETNSGIPVSDQGLASAIIPESREIIKGSIIRMELLTDIQIGETTIPRGESVYGIAGSLGAERIPITVSSIFYNRRSFPVSLQVLGMDGLPGLPIPGAFSREAMRESANQGLSIVGPATLDPSLGAQAATAGIQVARTLASRKIHLEKVRLQAGERVYLQDIKH